MGIDYILIYSDIYISRRGGGVKGPVIELRNRLAKEMVVIDCSEFRTSKLCLHCGRIAKFPKKGKLFGVTYCSAQGRDHHRMANRDVEAAFKIGARYLATKCGIDLGPWKRSTRLSDLQPSRVLKVVLESYHQANTYQEAERRLE